MINIPKFFKSLGFAFEGIVTLIRSENNAKIHLLATILVVLVSYFFKLNSHELLWVGLAITLVWVCEAINTALEKLVDLASPKIHPLAKIVKDIAAGSVLIASLFAIFTAIVIFGPKIF